MINGLDESLFRRKLSDWSRAVEGLTQMYIAAQLKFSQPQRKSAPPSDGKKKLKKSEWSHREALFHWELSRHTGLCLSWWSLTSGLSTFASCFSTADKKLWIFFMCDLWLTHWFTCRPVCALQENPARRPRRGSALSQPAHPDQAVSHQALLHVGVEWMVFVHCGGTQSFVYIFKVLNFLSIKKNPAAPLNLLFGSLIYFNVRAEPVKCRKERQPDG